MGTEYALKNSSNVGEAILDSLHQFLSYVLLFLKYMWLMLLVHSGETLKSFAYLQEWGNRKWRRRCTDFRNHIHREQKNYESEYILRVSYLLLILLSLY